MACSKYPKHRAYPSFRWWWDKNLSRQDDMKGGKLEALFGAGPQHMPYSLLYGDMSFSGSDPNITTRNPMYGNQGGVQQKGATWSNLGECGQPGSSSTSNEGKPPLSWICGPCAYWKWSAFYKDELQCKVYDKNLIQEDDEGNLRFDDERNPTLKDGVQEDQIVDEKFDVEGVYPAECEDRDLDDIFVPGGPDRDSNLLPGKMTLHQPHFASWISTQDARMQFKDTGGIPGSPVSFYLVPGQPEPQSDPSFAYENAKGRKFETIWGALWDFEQGSTPCDAWCSDVIKVGAVPCQMSQGCATIVISPHSPASHGSSAEAHARGIDGISCEPITSCCKLPICSEIGPKRNRPVPYWEKGFETFVEKVLCETECPETDLCTQYPIPIAKSQFSVSKKRELPAPGTAKDCNADFAPNLQEGMNDIRDSEGGSPLDGSGKGGDGEGGGENEWPGFCGDRNNPDGPCYKCSPQSKFNNMAPFWEEHSYEGPLGGSELCTDNRCPGCFGMYADIVPDQLSGELIGWGEDGKYRVCDRHSGLLRPIPMNSTCDLGSTAVLALEILGGDPCSFTLCDSYITAAPGETREDIISCNSNYFGFQMNGGAYKELSTPRTTNNDFYKYTFQKEKPCPVPVLPAEGDVLFLRQLPAPDCGKKIMCKWKFGKEEQDQGWWATTVTGANDITRSELIEWIRNESSIHDLRQIISSLKDKGLDPEDAAGTYNLPLPQEEISDGVTGLPKASNRDFEDATRDVMVSSGFKKCGKNVPDDSKCVIPANTAVEDMCYSAANSNSGSQTNIPTPVTTTDKPAPNTGTNHSGNSGVEFDSPKSTPVNSSPPIEDVDSDTPHPEDVQWKPGEPAPAFRGRPNRSTDEPTFAMT